MRRVAPSGTEDRTKASVGQKGGKRLRQGPFPEPGGEAGDEGGGQTNSRSAPTPNAQRLRGGVTPGPGLASSRQVPGGAPSSLSKPSQASNPQWNGQGRGWGEPGQTWFSPSLSKHHLGDQGSQGQFGNRESCPLPHLPLELSGAPRLLAAQMLLGLPPHGHLETAQIPQSRSTQERSVGTAGIGPAEASLSLTQLVDVAIKSQGEFEIEVGEGRRGWEGAGVPEGGRQERGPGC